MKISLKYILVVMVAVLFTWILHEFGHWITYTSLGYDYMMTLNKVSYLSGEKPSEVHQIIAGAAGPLTTIIQALVVFLLLKLKPWNKHLYPFLFAAFYMRFLAGVMNFIKPNDEGAISLYFGMGLYTISILVSGLLFFMIYHISTKHRLTVKFQLITVITTMIASSILVLLDQYIGVRIL